LEIVQIQPPSPPNALKAEELVRKPVWELAALYVQILFERLVRKKVPSWDHVLNVPENAGPTEDDPLAVNTVWITLAPEGPNAIWICPGAAKTFAAE
jgi:hypothetical protein